MEQLHVLQVSDIFRSSSFALPVQKYEKSSPPTLFGGISPGFPGGSTNHQGGRVRHGTGVLDYSQVGSEHQRVELDSATETCRKM